MANTRPPCEATDLQTVGSFVRSFSTEDLLHQAVAGLLSKMPEVSGVQILQGSQEYGKDIVFYVRGGFGEKILCACVVKNTKITGSVSSGSGARTVAHQAEQALDTPHLDAAGREVQYVITPREISPSAIKAVAGFLRRNPGQLCFVDGTALFDLFKQYWSNYLSEEFAALRSSLFQASAAIEEDRPLNQIGLAYKLDVPAKGLETVYVNPTFSRTLSSFSLNPWLASLPSNLLVRTRTMTRQPFELRPEDLREFQERTVWFERLRGTLALWGYADSELAAEVSALLRGFATDLERTWRDKVAAQFEHVRGSPSALDNSALVVGLRSDEASNLKSQIEKLQQQVHRVMEPLTNELSVAKAFVERPDGEGAALLESPGFKAAAALAEFVASAPYEPLTESRRLHFPFPETLLDDTTASFVIAGAAGFGVDPEFETTS